MPEVSAFYYLNESFVPVKGGIRAKEVTLKNNCARKNETETKTGTNKLDIFRIAN
jgi:hypothetical protein